ncbi:hypothetical protein BDV19DRAFT_395295 [Aspergillus venezuelensis]
MRFTESVQTPPLSCPSDHMLDQHVLDLGGWDQEDLMLVNWLFVDFRQRLLNVLYTSCHNNFNEARKLAKQRLLDLVERIATSDDLHGALLDPGSAATALQVFPPTPDLMQCTRGCDEPLPPSLLRTPPQKDAQEKGGLMCTPGDTTYHEWNSQVVTQARRRSPPRTGPTVLSPIAFDNHELPPGYSDFQNFDLLADGEVFSIDTRTRDNAEACDAMPLEHDLSEMELEPPPDATTTTNSSTRVSSPDIHPTHHLTMPRLSPVTPTPPSSLAQTALTQNPSRRPDSPSSAPQQRQVQTRAAVHAAYRSTPSPSPSAVTHIQAVNEVAETAPLSPSTSWTQSLPTHLPSPNNVLATFTHHVGPGKQSIALLLTRLFYAIGSPDALSQLRHAVRLSREQAMVIIPVSSTNDLATTVKALDHLDSMTTLSHVLRRYYLVRLLEYRIRLEQDHVTAKQACHRPKRMLKYDCARVELIKSGSDCSSSSTRKQTERKREPVPKYRSKSQALADLMQMLYPNLKPAAAEGKDCTVEKLPSDTVQMFLDYLQDHRGPFLRCVSQTLGTDIFSVLARTRTDGTPEYAFEKVEGDGIGDFLYDTNEFVGLCKHV